MNKLKANYNKIGYVLIFALVAFISVFCAKGMFTYDKPFTPTTSFAIYLPCFIVILAFLGFTLFCEYKFNKLSFKNVFLLLGILVAVNNTIAVLTLPSQITIEYATNPYIIPTYEKVYSLFYSYLIAFFPFLMAVVFPRKIKNIKSLKIVLYVLISVVSLLVFLSFILDFKAYINIIRSGFTDFSKPINSILGDKNIFGLFLLLGIMSCLILKALNKNNYLYIPIAIFEIIIIFTFAKTVIVISLLFLLIYLIIKLVILAKKSKQNAKIIILISSFIIFVFAISVVFIINSQSGLSFSIKNAIKNAINQGNTTLHTRMLIWHTSMNLLKPLQFLVGFGMVVVARPISIAYGSHPDCIEKPAIRILHTHNTFVQLLMEGGAIYILIYLIYLFILVKTSIKIIKHNKELGLLFIGFLCICILLGITDQTILFGDTTNVFLSVCLVVPLMSLNNIYTLNVKTIKK